MLLSITLRQVWPYYFFIPAATALIALLSFAYGHAPSRRSTDGAILLILVTVLGMSLVNLHDPYLRASHFIHHEALPEEWIGELLDSPAEKEKSVRAEVNILAFRQDSGWQNCTGNVVLYLHKNEAARQLRYGDRVLVKARLSAVAGPLNPGEFDYRQYLANRGISHRAYATAKDWVHLDRGGNPLIRMAHDLRDQLLGLFRHYGLEGQEFAVASALVLGYRADIDAELIQAYAGSGALHVLSVSGLHVGLIFVIMDTLLAGLGQSRRSMLIRTLLLLGWLWLYALLTGLPPSVMRATLMLSFIIAGRLLNRPPPATQTLTASAFLLLCFDPMLLTDAGFLLSYLAVAGLVFLYPKIRSLWEPRFRWLSWTWNLCAVSLAAQAATFPLSLYLFKQFPVYFLPCNLLIVPLATLILYVGIAVWLLAPFALAGNLAGKTLSWLVHFLNDTVIAIEQLPGAVWEWTLKGWECLCLYGVLMLLIAFLYRPKASLLCATLSLSSLFLLLRLHTSAIQLSQHETVIYTLRKETVISYTYGQRQILLTTLHPDTARRQLDFHFKSGQIERGVQHITWLPFQQEELKRDAIFRKGNFIQAGNIRIALINDSEYKVKSKSRIHTDMVLLVNNPRVSLEEITSYYDTPCIVADGSNSAFRLSQWEKASVGKPWLFYNCSTRGAWESGKQLYSFPSSFRKYCSKGGSTNAIPAMTK